MPRRFNVSGPCNPADHYMLPALGRLPRVRQIVDNKSYFVLHAPRQVGKTTALLNLGRELTAEGRYTALLVTMEVGAVFPHDPGAAELAVLGVWRAYAESWLPPDLRPPPWPSAEPGQRFHVALKAWAQASTRPLVVFIDEIDALQDETLVSALRQLRSGYPNRPQGFPWSLALIGLRDVRDYKVKSGGSDRLGTQSPFNISDDSLTLRDFTRAEVAELYQQHTDDTGQVFLPEARDLAFDLTQGQPWLVNALARQAVEVLVPDRAQPVAADDVMAAKELLIQRQDTHLDSLTERLREPRVRQIIEPMLAGRTLGDVPLDDLRFVQDLGLVRMTKEGGLDVANPIYKEVIPRVLTATPSASLPRIPATWLTPDGKLDAVKLRDAFLAFWRQHGEPLLGSAPYHEIAPHLVLMAFLHRVVNGGGSIDREYAIGTGRMDLLVRHGAERLAIELKVRRDEDPLAEGLAQLDAYLAGLGLETGWLVIFDRRPGLVRVADRTTAEEATTPGGRRVTVIRA
jgi:hypothetical protein